MKSDEDLAKLFVPVLAEHGVTDDFDHLVKVVHLIKERATFVADFWDIAWYLFKAPAEYAEKDAAKFWKPENVELALKVRLGRIYKLQRMAHGQGDELHTPGPHRLRQRPRHRRCGRADWQGRIQKQD